MARGSFSCGEVVYLENMGYSYIKRKNKPSRKKKIMDVVVFAFIVAAVLVVMGVVATAVLSGKTTMTDENDALFNRYEY